MIKAQRKYFLIAAIILFIWQHYISSKFNVDLFDMKIYKHSSNDYLKIQHKVFQQFVRIIKKKNSVCSSEKNCVSKIFSIVEKYHCEEPKKGIMLSVYVIELNLLNVFLAFV